MSFHNGNFFLAVWFIGLFRRQPSSAFGTV